MEALAPPFWLVWSPEGNRPPKYQHRSERSAQLEAERLAREHPGSRFFVLEPKTQVQCGTLHVVRFDSSDDGVPF